MTCDSCGRTFDADAFPRHFVGKQDFRCRTLRELRAVFVERDGVWHRNRDQAALFRRQNVRGVSARGVARIDTLTIFMALGAWRAFSTALRAAQRIFPLAPTAAGKDGAGGR